MGNFSRRKKHLLAVLFIGLLAAAGPLACTSPIPAQITLKTRPKDTATPLPVATATVPAGRPGQAGAPTNTPATKTSAPTQRPPTVRPPTLSARTGQAVTPTPNTSVASAAIIPSDTPPGRTSPAETPAAPALPVKPERTDTPAPATATPVPPTPSPSPTATVQPEQAATIAAAIAPAISAVKLQGEIHYDAQHGFAIVLPEGWQASVSTKDDTTYMANSEAVWKADVPPAPIVLVVTGPLDTLFNGAVAKARTASDVLMVAAGTLGQNWTVKVGTPVDMAVNGYPAASGIIEDGKPERRPQLLGRCVSVLLQGRAAVLWTIGPQAEWQAFAPTFDGMLASVTFPEPVPQGARANATRAAVPAAGATPTTAKAAPSKPAPRPTAAAPAPHSFPAITDLYVNGTEHYSLVAPTGWRVLEEGGMFTIAASVDDFSLPAPRGPVVEAMTGSLNELYEGAAKGTADANGLLQVAIQVQAGRGINVLGAPRPLTADGRNGLIVDVAGAGLRGQMLAVYLGNDRASLMGVLTPEDQWTDFAPLFQTMVGSLKFDVK